MRLRSTPGEPSPRRRRARGVLRVALSLGLVVAVFALALPRISAYGAVWDELRSVPPGWAAGLAAGAVLNVITLGLPWIVLVPGLGLVAALRITLASTALITVVPGGAPLGMAVSFGILRLRGVTASSAGFAVALAGIWNQLAIFLFPIVGLALVASGGHSSGVVTWVAVAGAVLAAVITGAAGLLLASREGTRILGDALRAVVAAALRLVRRDPPAWDGAAFVRLREDLLRLLRRRWPALTVATLVNQLTGYLMLVLALHAVGVGGARLSLAETFAAWSVGRLIGSLPLTPGGLGVVELGLVGTLLGFGGPHARTVAAVLAYRALVVLPTLVLGAVAGLTWRRRQRPAPPEA